MMKTDRPGLGELLRYVSELVDQGAAERYRALEIDYRPRYTPVLRAIRVGAVTVTDITVASNLTQGAISQTVNLMLKDGLIVRHAVDDGRKSGLQLTDRGAALLTRLEPHWETTFRAIDELEAEIGFPVLDILADLATALEKRGFADRLADAEKSGKA